jgi:hypothetical protein
VKTFIRKKNAVKKTVIGVPFPGSKQPLSSNMYKNVRVEALSIGTWGVFERVAHGPGCAPESARRVFGFLAQL